MQKTMEAKMSKAKPVKGLKLECPHCKSILLIESDKDGELAVGVLKPGPVGPALTEPEPENETVETKKESGSILDKLFGGE